MPDVSKPSSGACPYCGTAIGYKPGEMSKQCPKCKVMVSRTMSGAK